MSSVLKLTFVDFFISLNFFIKHSNDYNRKIGVHKGPLIICIYIYIFFFIGFVPLSSVLLLKLIENDMYTNVKYIQISERSLLE